MRRDGTVSFPTAELFPGFFWVGESYDCEGHTYMLHSP